MELRNLILAHIFFLVMLNLTFSFMILGFSTAFLFDSDDILDKKPKTARLANHIAFYINFLSFYLLFIIVFSYCFRKDGQAVCDAFKRISKSERKTIDAVICDYIYNGIYFLFIYIFYWPIYAIIKYFGKFKSRYVSLILIICVDILVFLFTIFSDNKDAGFIKAIIGISILQITFNLLSMIIPNTCWKCVDNETDPEIKPKKEEENILTKPTYPSKPTGPSKPTYTPPQVNPQPPSINMNVSVSIPIPVVNVHLPNPVIAGPHGAPHYI